MQRYPVRATHRRNLEGTSLAGILQAHFEGVVADGDSVTARWGAIERLTARGEGRELQIDLSMNPKVPEAVARETIARYNRFLEEATGYSAKERARRARKPASGPGD
ncbi:MAG TPA: DUF5611 family protein [Thermoplasmata archaeon]|nr:DUF5611 family protein [Thermoplasmata archaeon]